MCKWLQLYRVLIKNNLLLMMIVLLVKMFKYDSKTLRIWTFFFILNMYIILINNYVLGILNFNFYMCGHISIKRQLSGRLEW